MQNWFQISLILQEASLTDLDRVNCDGILMAYSPYDANSLSELSRKWLKSQWLHRTKFKKIFILQWNVSLKLEAQNLKISKIPVLRKNIVTAFFSVALCCFGPIWTEIIFSKKVSDNFLKIFEIQFERFKVWINPIKCTHRTCKRRNFIATSYASQN